MPAKTFCRVWNKDHERPVGRNCRKQRIGETTALAVSVSDSSDMSVNALPVVQNTAIPATSATGSTIDISALLLQKLASIDSKLTSLDGRVTQTETALADRTTDPSVPPVAATSSTA